MGVLYYKTVSFCRCISTCQEEGYQAAVVSPVNCFCIQDVSAALPMSNLVSLDFCEECRDSNSLDEPRECGNLAGSAVSLYFVQPEPELPANHGFSYWQCVDQPLYNTIEEVMPERMFSFSRYEGDASQCLANCSAENFNVAMIRNVNVKEIDEHPHLYDCYCLSEWYRFRSMDVDFNCLNYWCPSVRGPCVPAGQAGAETDPYMAAVYCAGEEACGTKILMPDTVSGVCEQDGENAKVTDSRVSFKVVIRFCTVLHFAVHNVSTVLFR